MPTAQQRRQKRELKRQDRRIIKMHSAIGIGHSRPVPTPPDFGPPKFTEEEQAANPSKPMTRVIKDVIRPGTWKEGFDEHGKVVYGKYTPERIGIMFSNAVKMMSAGHAINLGKNHGDDELNIATDDLIAPIDEFRLVNDVLWAAIYVTPAQEEYLLNPAIKTSPGMYRNYPSGDGNEGTYQGTTLLHLACTDRPTITGQGQFLALSNYLAFGTFSEAKHKRDKGKFASTGGGSAKKGGPAKTKAAAKPAEKDSKHKGPSAGKLAGTAAAVAVATAPTGKAERAIAKTGKKVGGKIVKKAAKVGFGLAKRIGKRVGGAAIKVGKKAAKVGAKVAVSAAKAGGKAAVKVGKHTAKKAGQLLVKAAKKAGKAGVKALKSKKGRQALRIGAKRVIRSIAKSPLRKVLRFGNDLMPRAIALANTLERGTTMDPVALLAALNALLAKLNIAPIPDDTAPELIVPILTGIALAIGGEMEEEAEEEVDPNAPIETDPVLDPNAPAPVQMSNVLTQVDKRIAAANKPLLDAINLLTTAVNGKNVEIEETAEAAYMRFSNELGKAGVPAAVLDKKKALAKTMGWNTEILEGIKPTITMASLVSSKAATENEPVVDVTSDVGNKILTDAEVQARITARGGNPALAPKAGV